MEFITIESHFGVPEHAIRPETRNICSKDLVDMIYRIAKILYPNEDFEVLILPSEVGSYADILKITGSIAIGVATIAGSVIGYLTYKDSHNQNKLEMIKGCIETTQLINGLSGEDIVVSDEVLNTLCEDHGVMKIKNNRYKTLEKDETIEYEETIIKNPDNQILLQEKIERSEFQYMIIPLPEDEDFEQENIEGIIELISLVVKQKKEGKGIPRRGTYYGDDIIHNGIKVLENGEEINFFMQDKDFKQQIKNQEITFSNGDNITASFKLKTEIRSGLTKNTYIHVQEVRAFNEAVIEHRIKLKKNSKQPTQMQKLFDPDIP